MVTKILLLILGLLLSFQFIWGQNMVYKRLLMVEQNSPEKLEKVATRYTKLFSKNPSGYFFLSKVQFSKFTNTQEDKEKSKHIYACLKLAHTAQELDKKIQLVEQDEWLVHREKVKYEGYFYPLGTSYTDNVEKIRKKYYSFISKGEKSYMLESELNLEVPREQKIDTLFYGMPSGKEHVKREFVEEEEKMLVLINQERTKMGLPAMKRDSALSAACRYQAYDMGTQHYVSHRGQDLGADGRVYFANYTFDRIRQFYNKTKLLGENISWGRDNAFYTYKGWYNSPAHNKIMFNPKNRLVGIGFIHILGSEEEYYWVLCTAE